jgi:hypothetical protein
VSDTLMASRPAAGRRRRGRAVAVVGAVVLAAGAATAAAVGFGGGGRGTRTAADLPPYNAQGYAARARRRQRTPTGNLDSASGHGIMAVLRELHAAGTTVVVITHDRELAAGLDRQVQMRDGQVVGDSAITPQVAGMARW